MMRYPAFSETSNFNIIITIFNYYTIYLGY
jgi:hypothetical protein